MSSTAHLRVVPALLGWEDRGAAFTAVIQLGTVAAILFVFGRDLKDAFLGWWNSIFSGDRSSMEAQVGWSVFVATFPISILGLALHKYIEGPFRSLYVIGTTLIVMAILMGLAEKFGSKSRAIQSVSVKDGLMVGLWQCLSLIPGMSRSGSTITGALFSGFDRESATRFSFLLSVPSITLAGLYEAYKARKEITGEMLTPVVIGTVVSFVVGYAAIKWLIRFIQSRGIGPFIAYRVILGVLIIGLSLSGKIDPAPPAEKNEEISPVVRTMNNPGTIHLTARS